MSKVTEVTASRPNRGNEKPGVYHQKLAVTLHSDRSATLRDARGVIRLGFDDAPALAGALVPIETIRQAQAALVTVRAAIKRGDTSSDLTSESTEAALYGILLALGSDVTQ